MNKSRPSIPSISNNPGTQENELFQNKTLRPILKQLNESWQLVFLQSCQSNSIHFEKLGSLKQTELINTSLSKNHKLKNQLIGMVMGQLNENELKAFLKNTSEFNKRILQMLKERIIDQLVE